LSKDLGTRSIADDPEAIRARAMETLFERLESLCEGAIAINRGGRVVYVNEKYLPALGLALASEALGRSIEEIIPNSLMRRWPARFTFDDYSLTDRFYSGVSRYTTSGSCASSLARRWKAVASPRISSRARTRRGSTRIRKVDRVKSHR
jgi:PAS domain-containing protein